MTRIEEMQGLSDAIAILREIRVSLCKGPTCVYMIVAHASDRIEKRLNDMVRGDE